MPILFYGNKNAVPSQAPVKDAFKAAGAFLAGMAVAGGLVYAGVQHVNKECSSGVQHSYCGPKAQ
ncbi:MAG: hypothetical protein DI551_09975 [Micavibrio aeruginosavorus]|uniref:Uncharacterized protein n=1 Tax=Micavibrio aeruginosavorus TaxID=349221 RepID=A0A2W5MUN2_9BACT|nr:MAG: hypothetical protein DI551_09975 [Micavibrio aeruginosavorus]